MFGHRCRHHIISKINSFTYRARQEFMVSAFTLWYLLFLAASIYFKPVHAVHSWHVHVQVSIVSQITKKNIALHAYDTWIYMYREAIVVKLVMLLAKLFGWYSSFGKYTTNQMYCIFWLNEYTNTESERDKSIEKHGTLHVGWWKLPGQPINQAVHYLPLSFSLRYSTVTTVLHFIRKHFLTTTP